MKISEIGSENKLVLKFIYKGKGYSLPVDIIKKEKEDIFITAILENETILDPQTMLNLEVLYIVKDGLYTYKNCKLKATDCDGMRAYAINSAEDVDRVNRREAYRIFIGEICKFTITPKDEPKIEMEGILKEISILGMGVIFNKEINVGSQVSIIYNFQGLNIHLLGEIIREDKVPHRKSFLCGCKYFSSNPLVNRVITLKQMKTIQRRVLDPE